MHQTQHDSVPFGAVLSKNWAKWKSWEWSRTCHVCNKPHPFPVSFQGLSQSHVSCGNTILHQQHPLQSPTLSHFLTPSPFLVIAYPLVANSLTKTKPANLPLLRRNTTSICPRASDVCCVSSSDGLSISSCDTPTPPPGNWGAKKSNFLEMR